jgi:hypothetical protein
MATPTRDDATTGWTTVDRRAFPTTSAAAGLTAAAGELGKIYE